jgi:hypothetical protein
MLLDTETLEYKFTPISAGFNRALASVSNGFMCGTQIVDPLNPGNAPSGTPAWISGSAVKVFRDGDPVTGLNIVVDQNSVTTALFQQYTSAWGIGANGTRTFDAATGSYTVIDSDRVNGYSVLAQNQNYLYGFASSSASFINFTQNLTTVFDLITATKTGPFPVSEGYAWLTEGGPVAYKRGDNGNDRLVRYRWGTGDFTTVTQAEELDSMDFEDDEDIKLLSFDPSGTWWYLYDRMDGKLYKLRTWWK